MRNIWTLSLYTIREALARKVFLFFIIISGLVLLLELLIFSLVDADNLLNSMNVTGDAAAKGEILIQLELAAFSFLSSLLMLLAIFASASFLPNMLEKGTVDLFLSKPISRTQALLGKYFGGVLVVFINVAFMIISMWLLVSIKFAYWDFSILWTIFFIVFVFASLYSIITLLGVITQGSTAGMMTAYFIYLILSPILYQANLQIEQWTDNDIYIYGVKSLYQIFPKTAELLGKNLGDIVTGAGFDVQPVITSFLFLVLMLILSIGIFKKKDF